MPQVPRRVTSRGCLIAFFCLLWLLPAFANPFHASPHILHTIDFSNQPDGEALTWLQRQGYTLYRNAQDLSPRFQNGRLVLEATSEAAGIFTRALNLPGVRHLRVLWGVERYPQGADWGKGVHRLPIGVMVSFGQEKLTSGSLFLPAAPYFLGVFLGEKEQEQRAYTGTYFKKGGRYFCQPCGATPGQTVVTEFDLEQHFTEQFQQRVLPPVSGFSFQMNTTDTTGGARAFLVRVEFLD
jgi:hypothetical protein